MIFNEPIPFSLAYLEGLTRKKAQPRSEIEFDTIRTFWIGKKLPDFHHMCLKSWLKIGYKVEVFAYGAVENLPKGCDLIDASTIMPHEFIFENAETLSKRPFTRANIFRLALLMQDKGPWCDADYYMFRPLPKVRDILVGQEKNGKLCNAIIWLPPEHDLLPRALKTFEKITTGPWSYFSAYTARFKIWAKYKSGHETYPKHQWGRHILEYCVNRDKLMSQVQNYKKFYYPVIYNNMMYKAENAFDHIIEDPEVLGLHFFYKPDYAFHAAEKGSFIDWAKQHVHDHS